MKLSSSVHDKKTEIRHCERLAKQPSTDFVENLYWIASLALAMTNEKILSCTEIKQASLMKTNTMFDHAVHTPICEHCENNFSFTLRRKWALLNFTEAAL